MIFVNYSGRLGNNMFQYALGRMLAEQFSYSLKASSEKFPFQEQFENAFIPKGREYDNDPIIIDDTKEKNITLPQIIDRISNNRGRKIVLNGFFQKWEFYKRRFSDLRLWFKLPEDNSGITVSKNDVICHFRRDDYKQAKSCLSFDYYDAALLENFGKIFITGDIDNEVRAHFDKLNPTYISMPEIETLRFFKRFKNIILANSTFSWWGSILSDANRIIYPEPISGYWSMSQDQRLFADGLMTKYVNIGVSK